MIARNDVFFEIVSFGGWGRLGLYVMIARNDVGCSKSCRTLSCNSRFRAVETS
jgi:hypothetical protein